MAVMEKDKEETPAQRGKLEAETKKLMAELALVGAQARKADEESAQAAAETQRVLARVRSAEAEALVAEITRDRIIRQRAEEQALDRYHHVYHFEEQVGGSAVGSCIHELNMWRRIDPQCDMEIIFTSPGGNVFAGMTLFDHIQTMRREGHKVTTGTLGFAASMAGILLQAGDHRWMGREAYVLIHQVSTLAIGKLPDMEDEVKFLKMMSDRVLDIFATRAAEAGRNGTAKHPLSKKQFATKWDRKDWWVTSSQALDWGIVDEVR